MQTFIFTKNFLKKLYRIKYTKKFIQSGSVTIKYYSNQKDKASKKIVEHYKKQRPILKDKIKIELKKKGIK